MLSAARARCTPRARRSRRPTPGRSSSRCWRSRTRWSSPRSPSRSPAPPCSRAPAGCCCAPRCSAIPFALLIALVNPLVADEGLTVLCRFGELGPLGQVDVTLEGLAFGAILGLRALLIVLASAALLTATVDADELLRGFRRISVRSALTAALAVRLVPVLGRDARRLADARRCRPDATPRGRAPPSGCRSSARSRRARWTARSTSPRRSRCAATRPPARRRRGACASRGRATTSPSPRRRSAILALALGARLLGIGSFDAYPFTVVAAGPREWLLAVAFVVVALVPFADRRGIVR